MKAALRDRFGHPHAVSRHADPAQGHFDQLQTVASIIVDCDHRTCWIALGPPDENEYSRYQTDGRAAFGPIARGTLNRRTTVVSP